MKIEASVGEVIDKITILEIKESKFRDHPEKHAHVVRELTSLKASLSEEVTLFPELEERIELLRKTNLSLWNVEDTLRWKEQKKEFDEEFIYLARSVYRLNDYRAQLKREINDWTGSEIVEEKSYHQY